MNGFFYVCQIVGRHDGDGENINLIGPFSTQDDARDYGATHCSPGGPDDPRWNTIHAPVIRHLTPAKWKRGAYARSRRSDAA